MVRWDTNRVGVTTTRKEEKEQGTCSLRASKRHEEHLRRKKAERRAHAKHRGKLKHEQQQMVQEDVAILHWKKNQAAALPISVPPLNLSLLLGSSSSLVAISCSCSSSSSASSCSCSSWCSSSCSCLSSPPSSHSSARSTTEPQQFHHQMATLIQALFRGHQGRLQAQTQAHQLDQKLASDALHELQTDACCRIQSIVRGMLVRQKMSHFTKPRISRLKWPRELNLEHLDPWNELTPSLTASFLAQGLVRVFCGTWNMHATKPTADLRRWIPFNKYHVVAIGSEECGSSIAQSVVFPSKKPWEEQLSAALGPNYVLVASHALTAIHNVVFVHQSVVPYLGHIQSDAVATGLGNQWGNKGGVGIAFTLGTSSFVFINSHFDAHQRNVTKRNRNFHRINHELRLGLPMAAATESFTSRPVGLGRTAANRFSLPSVTVKVPPCVSDTFDRVFWFGDLNYRINGTRRMVETLIRRQDHEVLYANDQLQREMKAGNVFQRFHEGPLHFRPTYKFDLDSDVYDSSSKQRIPSWTDRILYLSNQEDQDIQLLSYRSEQTFRSSDHRPVAAVFQVRFQGIMTTETTSEANNVSSKVCVLQ